MSHAQPSPPRRATLRCAVLALLIALPVAAAGACGVKERDILGAWKARGDAGDFEAFEFSAQGGAHRFSSWLHERPEIVDADWSLRDCVLTITPRRNEMPAYQFQVSMKKGRLQLREAPRMRSAEYVRVRR